MSLVSPLSVSDSAVKLYNAALSILGLPKVASFLEETPQSKVGNALVGDSIEAMLASYPWRFARKQITLAEDATEIPAPWSCAFTLPSSALLVRSVWEADQKVVFDIFERRVVTMGTPGQAAVTKAEVTDFVTVGSWPGYFRKAAIYQIAADVAMPLTQDERTAVSVRQEAIMHMTFAKTRDAQGRTPSVIDTKGFIRARRGGRR